MEIMAEVMNHYDCHISSYLCGSQNKQSLLLDVFKLLNVIDEAFVNRLQTPTTAEASQPALYHS